MYINWRECDFLITKALNDANFYFKKNKKILYSEINKNRKLESRRFFIVDQYLVIFHFLFQSEIWNENVICFLLNDFIKMFSIFSFWSIGSWPQILFKWEKKTPILRNKNNFPIFKKSLGDRSLTLFGNSCNFD